MHTVRRLRSPVIFLVVVAVVYAAALYIRGILATLDSPQIIAGALVADLVILVPAAYYFLVVRRFGWPVISVAGIFVLSLIAATQIIPPEQQRVITPLEIIAGIAEVSILGFIVWKAAKGVRRFRAAASRQHDEDAFHAIREAARQVIDSERVADIFAYEIGMFYYGLGSWRRSLVERPGLYTNWKRSNYGATLFGIGVLLIVELVAVHVIVQIYWGATGAWILSILSAYTGIWLLSEWRAHRLRPTLIDADALVLRAGVRWEVTIPFARIQSLRRIGATEDKLKGTLNLVVFDDALFEVRTDAPVEAIGPYGMRKSTDCVWFSIDEPSDFEATLASRVRGKCRVKD